MGIRLVYEDRSGRAMDNEAEDFDSIHALSTRLAQLRAQGHKTITVRVSPNAAGPNSDTLEQLDAYYGGFLPSGGPWGAAPFIGRHESEFDDAVLRFGMFGLVDDQGNDIGDMISVPPDYPILSPTEVNCDYWRWSSGSPWPSHFRMVYKPASAVQATPTAWERYEFAHFEDVERSAPSNVVFYRIRRLDEPGDPTVGYLCRPADGSKLEFWAEPSALNADDLLPFGASSALEFQQVTSPHTPLTPLFSLSTSRLA